MSTEGKSSISQVAVPCGPEVDVNFSELTASRMGDFVTGYALVNALFSFVDLGLEDELDGNSSIDPIVVSNKKSLNLHHLTGLLRFLGHHDVFKEHDKRFWLTPFGRNLLSP